MSERLTLLPCPACGNATLDRAQGMFCHFIACENCGLSIRQPEREDADVIKAWNALPRALVWTTELPKEGGNYWWICEDESIDTPQMVNVIITDGRFHFYFHYSDGPCFHTCEKCQWVGPIPMPKEPV